MHCRKSIFPLTSLALSITDAIGQESAALDSVVVTGRCVEATLEETPQRIEVIDKDDIAHTSGKRSVGRVDPYRGDMLSINDGVKAPAGDIFVSWQLPQHGGSAIHHRSDLQ